MPFQILRHIAKPKINPGGTAKRLINRIESSQLDPRGNLMYNKVNSKNH